MPEKLVKKVQIEGECTLLETNTKRIYTLTDSKDYDERRVGDPPPIEQIATDLQNQKFPIGKKFKYRTTIEIIDTQK